MRILVIEDNSDIAANIGDFLADKGHVAELEAFARYLRGETAAPIPLAELVATTEITLQVTTAPSDPPQELQD